MAYPSRSRWAKDSDDAWQRRLDRERDRAIRLTRVPIYDSAGRIDGIAGGTFVQETPTIGGRRATLTLPASAAETFADFWTRYHEFLFEFVREGGSAFTRVQSRLLRVDDLPAAKAFRYQLVADTQANLPAPEALGVFFSRTSAGPPPVYRLQLTATTEGTRNPIRADYRLRISALSYNLR